MTSWIDKNAIEAADTEAAQYADARAERQATLTSSGLPSFESLAAWRSGGGQSSQEEVAPSADATPAASSSSLTDMLPSFGSLRSWATGGGDQYQPAPSPSTDGSAPPNSPSSIGDYLPSFSSLAVWRQPEQKPTPTPSGAPEAMPTSPSNRYNVSYSSGPSADPSSIANAGGRASRFASQVAQVAQEEGVPADVLAGLIDTEDSGETSVSPAGARGIMQVVPGQGYDLPGEDASDPLTSIRQGARAIKDKYKQTGSWDTAGGAYFGYGTDAGGMTTGGYQDRYIQNRAKYQGAAPANPASQTVATQAQPVTRTAAAPAVSDSSTAAMPQGEPPTSASGLRPSQFDPQLSRAEAIAACGLAGAVGFAAKTGRYPTVSEARNIAANQNLWDPGSGMHGPDAEVALLKQMGVATRRESGVDWTKVRRDVQAGNPVMFDTDAGSDGHYYFVENARQRPDGQWEYDLGTSATDLRAANGRHWFTADEVGSLGFGNPANTIYLDDPTTLNPSRVAGRSRPNKNDPTGVAIRAAAATPAALPEAQTAQPVPDDQGASDDGGQMLRQPIGAPPGEGAPYQDDQTQNGQTPPLPKPGTLVPIQNPDGSVSTELSITVTEPGLNGGQPTNIPTVWDGQRVSDQQAIDNAIRSGVQFQAYPSIKLAVKAAKQRTQDLGAGRATSVGGAIVPATTVDPAQPNLNPSTVDAATGLNRSLTNNVTGQRDQYRMPIGAATPGPDTTNGTDSTPIDYSQEPVEGPPAPSTAPSAPSTSSEQSASPFVPLYDAAGRIKGYVEHGVQQVVQAAQTANDAATSAVNTATGAISQADQSLEEGLNAAHLPNAPAIVRNIAGQFIGPEAGIATVSREMQRAQEIQNQAADWIAQHGRKASFLTAANDAAWRAANPDDAKEYDDLQHSLTLTVGGMVGAGGEHPAPEGASRPAGEAAPRAAGEAAPIETPIARPSPSNSESAPNLPASPPSEAPPSIPNESAINTQSEAINQVPTPAENTAAQPSAPSLPSAVEQAHAALDNLEGQGVDVSQARAALPERPSAQPTPDVPPGSLVHTPTPDGAPGDGLWLTKPTGEAFTADEAARVQASLERRGLRAYPSADGTTLTIPSHDAPSSFVDDVVKATREAGYGPEALTAYHGETTPAPTTSASEGAGAAPHTSGVPERSALPEGSADRVAATPAEGGSALEAGRPGADRQPGAGEAGALPDRNGSAAPRYSEPGVQRPEGQPSGPVANGGVEGSGGLDWAAQEALTHPDPAVRARMQRRLRGPAAQTNGEPAATVSRGTTNAESGPVPPERRLAFEAEQARLWSEGALPTADVSAAQPRLLDDDPLQQGVTGIAPPGAVHAGPQPLPPNLPPQATNWYQRTAARNAKRLAANGQQPLSPLRWVGGLAKSASYSSLIGPPTAAVNFLANLSMPIWSTPKEALARPITRAITTRNTAALREYPTAAFAFTTDLMDVGQGMWDALGGRGKYAQNPNHPMLSGQTVNPIGQKIAQTLELGNRVYSALPDAIFGTLAENFGERLKAAQTATDLGLHGHDWAAITQGLIEDARAARAGQAPTGPTSGMWIAAQKEADAQGLRGVARQQAIGQWLQDAVDRRAGQFVGNPMLADQIIGQGDAIVSQAIDAGRQYADHQTFRDALGPFGRKARAASGADLPVVGPLITPFFNTNWNVGKRLAENSPIGPLANRARPRFDKTYDAIVGTAALAGLAAYGTSGLITGSGPSDLQERRGLEANGWQPYSTLINGVYVPNRYFGFAEGPLNMAGDWHDHVAYQKKDATWQQGFNDMAARVGRQIQNAPTLQGWASIISAFSGQNPASGAERWVSGQVTREIPYAATARAIGTSQDPSERVVEQGKNVPPETTIGQQVQSGVGARSGLPVAQDVLGRPKENQQQGVWAFFPKMSRAKADPIIQAFQDNAVDISTPSQDLSLSLKDANGRVLSTYQVPMTPAEQREWNRLRGEGIVRQLAPVLDSDKWKNASPSDRQKYLQDRLSDANEYAKNQLQDRIGVTEIRRRIGQLQEQKAS